MKAIHLEGYGERDVLKWVDIECPKPNAEELLVRVHASSVNRADILQRKGKYPPPPGASNILGLDIAGEVIDCAPELKSQWLGKRVFGLVSGGAYAEYCCIDSGMAMEIPDTMDDLTAAAIPEIFLTAHASLIELAGLKAHEKILIHAAGSGVGTAALQLAQQLQCEIFVTAGSEAKISRLIDLGAKAGFNYKNQSFDQELLRQVPQGVDVILDFAGASLIQQNINVLAEDGRMVMLALMGGAQSQIDLRPMIQKRLKLFGFTLRNRSLSLKRKWTQQFQQCWMPTLAAGHMAPMIDSVFDLHDIQKAHERLESNANFGKIVLRI